MQIVPLPSWQVTGVYVLHETSNYFKIKKKNLFKIEFEDLTENAEYSSQNNTKKF